jgi:pilus assembly protein CpaB
MDPGRTNRRFVLLAVTLGLLGAVLVYVAFSRESAPGGSSAASTADTPVVVAKGDIPARTRITNSMVEVQLVPRESAGALSFPDLTGVVGSATRFPIAANEQVLASKIVPLTVPSAATSRSLSFIVPQGKRGVAVTASPVQNAGGLVLPGDYVDIMVIYDVEFASGADRQEEDSFLVQTIMQNVEVLAVALAVVDVVPEATPTANGQRVRNTEAPPLPEAATVTLALTPEQAQRIYLAESNGRIRFTVRPFGEANEQPIEFMTELELFPRNLPNPFTR